MNNIISKLKGRFWKENVRSVISIDFPSNFLQFLKEQSPNFGTNPYLKELLKTRLFAGMVFKEKNDFKGRLPERSIYNKWVPVFLLFILLLLLSNTFIIKYSLRTFWQFLKNCSITSFKWLTYEKYFFTTSVKLKLAYNNECLSIWVVENII